MSFLERNALAISRIEQSKLKRGPIIGEGYAGVVSSILSQDKKGIVALKEFRSLPTEMCFCYHLALLEILDRELPEISGMIPKFYGLLRNPQYDEPLGILMEQFGSANVPNLHKRDPLVMSLTNNLSRLRITGLDTELVASSLFQGETGTHLGDLDFLVKSSMISQETRSPLEEEIHKLSIDLEGNLEPYTLFTDKIEPSTEL